MPRLFTGLEIPESVGLSLSMLRGGLAGARWVDPENYHVTLRSIGDVDDRTAYELVDLLTRVRRRQFDITVQGLGSFGGGKPRAVYAALHSSAALGELQSEHERICQRAGLEPNGRRFTPHVTLARLNRDASAEGVANYLTLRGGVRLGPFRVDRFVLFSSKASTGGGPYVVEETYPLA
jgi:RNA 2',3'-cyclic 3'-phosphodiesterase